MDEDMDNLNRTYTVIAVWQVEADSELDAARWVQQNEDLKEVTVFQVGPYTEDVWIYDEVELEEVI